MGTYKLSADEIADEFENSEFEEGLEGNFSEKDFIDGAREYINRLRLKGAFIPKNEHRRM